MHITVKTFAQTRELSGEDNISLDLEPDATIDTVIKHLTARGSHWELALSGSILSARNHQLCDKQTVLNDGDEVAFFPPVTGG
ncbi:molybdopterin synthase sulfur carrier subunit [Alteromonas sp. KUL42]|nr:molybdopterin synthase sulfur carrier subunit [Alteromonas sp. KUL42]GEA06459.1 molybdopterin synthase sulfur carrier subunit [Alteromonas sp. KUL42]